MVIGIASVIIVYSAGAGIESLVLGQIESFGTNGFVVNGIPTNMIETDIESAIEKIIENHKISICYDFVN